MKKRLLVVGGERYWHEHLPEYEVVYCRLQGSQWLLEGGQLFMGNGASRVAVDGVFWRVGAVTPEPWHRHVLELLRLSGVPCVNPAEALLRGHDKLSVLAELRGLGIPVVPVTIAVGAEALTMARPVVPSVLKLGNLHGGTGKARIQSASEWTELVDLAAASREYAMVEPFIDYARDVRCIRVGERFWAMARHGTDWKVNRGVVEPRLIATPGPVQALTEAIAHRLGADVLGVDFLEDRGGGWHVLECNDPPGLTGFPPDVQQATAEVVRRALG
jgi:ribosomal protein S6--L-glutamate ligase